MPTQAKWALELKKKTTDVVPEQITIIRKISPQKDNLILGAIRTTGYGVDDVLQPSKMAGQVHEGEGVLSANAMQNFTPEEFEAFNRALASGNINKNLFRQAIGLTPVRGYQSGGVVSDWRATGSGAPSHQPLSTSIQTQETQPQTITVKPVTRTETEPISIKTQPITIPTIQTQPIKNDQITIKPITATAQETIKTQPIKTQTTHINPYSEGSKAYYEWEERNKAPVSDLNQKVNPYPEGSKAAYEWDLRNKEINDEENKITVKPITQVVPEPIKTQFITKDITTPATPTTAKEETTTEKQDKLPTAISTQAQSLVQEALGNLSQRMKGMSETDKNIINFYLSNIDARNAANLRVLEQQISADPYMSEQAKQAAIAGLQRDMEAKRSEVAGELAKTSMKSAEQATGQAISYGQQVRVFEEEAARNKDNADWKAYEAAIAAGDYDTAAKMYKSITGSDISMENMKIYRDYINRKNEQELISGNLIITAKTIANEADRLGVDIKRLSAFADAINKGSSLEVANQVSGLNISAADFVTMLNASELGERNWKRMLSAANMLLATPGAENKVAAASIYSNLFEGVNFDFSELITSERQELFTEGLSLMASYVTTNAKFEDVYNAMVNQGIPEMLNMGKEELAQLYNSMRVNALDQQWQEIYESDMYQSLLNSNDPEDIQLAEDINDFYIRSSLGLIDYEVLHGYNIYDKNGTLVNVIYAKDDTEAAKFVAGKNMTYEKTNKVQYQLSSTLEATPHVGGQESTPTNEQYNDFTMTVPTGETPPSYEVWREAGQPENWDAYKKSESAVNKLKSMTFTSSEELLEPEKSKILWQAYNEDKDAVKKTNYFFSFPNKGYLSENISTKKSLGVRTTTITQTLEQLLGDARGKITEITTDNGERFIGQVVDFRTGPGALTITIRNENGQLQEITINKSSTNSGVGIESKFSQNVQNNQNKGG